MLPGGRLRKIDSDNQIGPGALRILAINPLYLRVSYGEPDRPTVTLSRSTTRLRRIRLRAREKHHRFPQRPQRLFIVKSITGPPDNPPRLDLEFKDTHEAITVTPDKPYERVAGHTADLSYPPETNLAPWTGLRVGDHLRFEGGDYIVFAINDNSVVVSSRDNNKKTPSLSLPQRDALNPPPNARNPMIKAALHLFFLACLLAAPPYGRRPTTPPSLATDEAVRRQANTIKLQRELADAREAQQRNDLPEAARLYQECYNLAQSIGDDAKELQVQVLAGRSTVLLALAKQDQDVHDYSSGRGTPESNPGYRSAKRGSHPGGKGKQGIS